MQRLLLYLLKPHFSNLQLSYCLWYKPGMYHVISKRRKTLHTFLPFVRANLVANGVLNFCKHYVMCIDGLYASITFLRGIKIFLPRSSHHFFSTEDRNLLHRILGNTCNTENKVLRNPISIMRGPTTCTRQTGSIGNRPFLVPPAILGVAKGTKLTCLSRTAYHRGRKYRR